jgi:hypothetical protein
VRKQVGITVIDVMRDMGIEPATELAWRVGARVRAAYEWETGMPPPKHLRDKTNEGGSHCFAVYPESMRPRIELIIRNQRTQDQQQGDLFQASKGEP